MIQEEKDLLLKDLCARLPYGVKFQSETVETVLFIDTSDGEVWINGTSIDDFKPYLFPLSSLTEEQYEKFIIASGWDGDIEDVRRGKFSCIGDIGLDYIYDTIDWLNKNHFDYRNLINKNLAIDATNLNIY